MITGEIIDHPVAIFTKIDETKCMMGFVYPIETTTIINYEIKEVQLWITSVYDLRKWDIIKKGDKLTLSILKKQTSQYAPDGVSLKCNIVSRQKK